MENPGVNAWPTSCPAEHIGIVRATAREKARKGLFSLGVVDSATVVKVPQDDAQLEGTLKLDPATYMVLQHSSRKHKVFEKMTFQGT
jgi:hypothetical protein